MDKVLKSISIISIVMLMSFFGHNSKAQETPTSKYLDDICKSTIPNGKGCVNLCITRTITLKEFKDCPLTVDILVSICNGDIYLYPERVFFADPKCKELTERIFNGTNDPKFISWLTKNIYYEVAISIFEESRDNHAEDTYHCPNGRMFFTGFSASCEGMYIYKMSRNPFCLQCDCFGDYYSFERVPCTLSGCCTFKFNVCLDKESGKILINREDDGVPVENSCNGATFLNKPDIPKYFPINPIFNKKYLYEIIPCATVCEFDYEYGDPMPN